MSIHLQSLHGHFCYQHLHLGRAWLPRAALLQACWAQHQAHGGGWVLMLSPVLQSYYCRS